MKNEAFLEVNNLSDYISCVSKYSLDNYISRGENQKHSNITASAFRYQNPISFQTMISEFYSVIGNSITNMQRDNFIAFSQHHGIPTNLIDFSTSPLVSLFFACYDASEKYADSGYVYFIRKDKLININEMMLFSQPQVNLFQELVHFDSSILPIITKMYTYEHTHIEEIVQIIINWSTKLKSNLALSRKYELFLLLLDEFIELTKTSGCYTLANYSDKLLYALLGDNKSDDGCLTNYILWEDYIEDFHDLIACIKDNFEYTYWNDLLLILILIRVVLGELYDTVGLNESPLINNIELPFYFTYAPPNILPRITNQSSLFIYQLFYDKENIDTYIDKTKNRIVQAITPDFTIRINNKRQIINSLDLMGINLKFIYNDYDNIAKYIKSNELKKNIS